MRSTLRISFAQTSHVYVTWRWLGHSPQQREAARLDPQVLQLPEQLQQRLPDPLPGENISEAIERALTGPFGDPENTRALGERLADVLLPADIVFELQRHSHDRPRVVIQPCPAVAGVPWALLRPRIDASGRSRVWLTELADLALAVPTIPGRGHTTRTVDKDQDVDGSTVAVIDPRVPEQPADGPLGSVLGRPVSTDPLAALLDDNLLPAVTDYVELPRRRDVDAPWVRQACSEASRLLYVGHVTSPDIEQATALDTAMHLAQTEPVTAQDIITNNWSMPPRVALLACGSGTDSRYFEPVGLTTAMAVAGAQVITSTLWTLPTDIAFPEAAVGPLRQAILAVHQAQKSEDPSHALTQWQYQCATNWDYDGDQTYSPLVWAALMTFLVGVDDAYT